MKALRTTLPAAVFLFFSLSVFAQPSPSPEKPKIPFKDRLVLGGNFGLSFGSTTYISLTPLLGYRITDKWIAGGGINYTYWKDNYYDVSSSIYGGTIFTRYLVYSGFYVEGYFEENNLDAYNYSTVGGYPDYLGRQWIPSLLLGGGYASSIGNNSGFFISILYDVLQNQNSPYYGIPVIRAGMGFGL